MAVSNDCCARGEPFQAPGRDSQEAVSLAACGVEFDGLPGFGEGLFGLPSGEQCTCAEEVNQGIVGRFTGELVGDGDGENEIAAFQGVNRLVRQYLDTPFFHIDLKRQANPILDDKIHASQQHPILRATGQRCCVNLNSRPGDLQGFDGSPLRVHVPIAFHLPE